MPEPIQRASRLSLFWRWLLLCVMTFIIIIMFDTELRFFYQAF